MKVSLVIVEGAEFASALATTLRTIYGYHLVAYNPAKGESFKKHLQYITPAIEGRPKVVLAPFHLAALSAGQIDRTTFRILDNFMWELDARLILAVGQDDKTNSGFLTEGYSHSVLPKVVYRAEQPITDLLKWLGVNVSPIRQSS